MAGYNIPEVTTLCTLADDALEIDRVSQVEHLSSIREMDLERAKAFYSRNHVTDGMSTFLRGALKRLHSGAGQGIYELRQAMGGGKTHNMIMLGLLSRFPELASDLPEGLLDDIDVAETRLAVVNGRSIDHHLMGDIALQLGGDRFSKHWSGTPEGMNEGNWIDLIGDEPTLIMLDELPPYLSQARTRELGKGTLLDVVTYSISNLLSAAMKLPRCVVVIGSLDAAYSNSGAALDELYTSAVSDLKSETERGAKSITPVDLNTSEIYDILRKRLFSSIPDRDGEEVMQVVDAYAEAVQEAIKGKAIAKSAEQIADEIQESYPFHPGYKDILALFKENPKFRQTRGLIEFTSNLLRAVWNDKEREHFLIGAQFLDFADLRTRDQVKDIEKSLESALATDIYDRDGSAHAQGIVAASGDPAAMEVATLLFISSLSDNTDGIRGLRFDDVTSYLVAPGRDPSSFLLAFERLQKECWYLHTKDGERFYFSDVANVRKQIEDKMAKIQQDQVDDEVRRLLTDCFEDKRRDAYQELAVLPRREDIKLSASKRTCIVLSPDAKAPPETAIAIFENEIYKNNFCVVSSDGSRMGKAEDAVRRIIAVTFVRNSVTDPRHVRELDAEAKEAERSFITEIKSLFNTVWYPAKDQLRSTPLIFDASSQGAVNGEDAIEKALKDIKLLEVTDEKMKALIAQAEERLFGSEKQVKWGTILERAAHNPLWPWLPPKGLDAVKAEALRQERWSEENGIVDIAPAPPKPVVKVTEARWIDRDGVYDIELFVSNTSKNAEILVATTRDGLETSPELVEGRNYRSDKVELWFKVRDLDKDEESDPISWTGELHLTHDPIANGHLWVVSLDVKPNAEIRWNLTGAGAGDTANDTLYDGNPIEIDGSKRTSLHVHAQSGGVRQSKVFELPAIDGKDDEPEIIPVGRVRLLCEISLGSKGQVVRAIQNLKLEEGVNLSSLDISVGQGDGYVRLRGGRDLAVSPSDLEKLIESLVTTTGNADAETTLKIGRSSYPDYHMMARFMKEMGLQFTPSDVEKED